MKFVYGSDLTSSIRQTVSKGGSDIAVAFWGYGACERLDLPSDCGNYRVICDAFSGACNPSAIRELRSRGADVKTIAGLHAKVYIGPNSMVSCSANASANGLGEENSEIEFGLEAGFFSDNRGHLDEAGLWFSELFEPALCISDDDMEQIEALWQKRRSGRPFRNAEISLARMIRDKSPHLADRNIKICVYTIEEEVPAVIEETFQRSRFFDEGRYDEEDPPFFWEAGHWGVKRGDNLICFAAERNNISFEGLWQVEGLIDTGGIIAVEPTPNLFGKEVKARDSGKICRMVRSLIENGEIRADMAPMPILDFALLTDQL